MFTQTAQKPLHPILFLSLFLHDGLDMLSLLFCCIQRNKIVEQRNSAAPCCGFTARLVTRRSRSLASRVQRIQRQRKCTTHGLRRGPQ
jgi:hypothetical protein